MTSDPLANVQHFAGRVDVASSLFAEAADLAAAEPAFRPNAVHEFQHDDLLLSQGDGDAVQARERRWPNREEYLMAGLAALPAALVKLARQPSDETRRAVHDAADLLERAGRVEYQPRRYLALGEVYLSAGEWHTALELLAEGMQYCRQHELRLGVIDLRLMLARVYDAAGNPDRSGEERSRALGLIRECGYAIRLPAARPPGREAAE